MKYTVMDSSEQELVEELSKKYFADLMQWWDNGANNVWLLDVGKWIQCSDIFHLYEAKYGIFIYETYNCV